VKKESMGSHVMPPNSRGGGCEISKNTGRFTAKRKG